MNLICVRSHHGAKDFLVSCPDNVEPSDGVQVVNGLITQSKIDAKYDLKSPATWDDFDDAVKARLDKALATIGYCVVDFNRLPGTTSWNR